MSKNQKPTSKLKPKVIKTEVAKPGQVKECCEKCECAIEDVKFEPLMPEYDELVAINASLTEKLNAKATVENQMRCLLRDIDQKDETIRNLQENVDFYRNRGVWATIMYKWFGRC